MNESPTCSAKEIVEGTIRSVVYHNDENGYTVLHVEIPSEFELARNPEITIVGKAQAVWEGEDVKAEGQWVTDKVHGRQFKAESLTCIAPRSLKGIERYLASGLIKGVGKVLAKRIVDTFGEETMNVLSHQSGRLREVPKLGTAKIRQIRESWHQNETMRENMIFGQTYGISIIKMTKIVRKYGPDAIAIIKADPYKLCRDIWGIGFATADKIALSVGIPKDSPLRARASITYTLETEAEDGGHCWTYENDLLLHANELTGIPMEVLGEALRAEIESGRVVVESNRVVVESNRVEIGSDSVEGESYRVEGESYRVEGESYRGGIGSNGAERIGSNGAESREDDVVRQFASQQTTSDSNQTLKDSSQTLKDSSQTLKDSNLTLIASNLTLKDPSPPLIVSSPALLAPNSALRNPSPPLIVSNLTLRDPNPTLKDSNLPRKVYLKSLYYSERDVARRVKAILSAPRSFAPIEPQKAIAWWQGRAGFELAPKQQLALERSLVSKFSIITGGPGVGKTTIIRALVEIYQRKFQACRASGSRIGQSNTRTAAKSVNQSISQSINSRIILAAPTGRAAKRMTESVGVAAQTIHRLLKWNPVTNRFTYDAENQLEGDVFIFDETSMIDVKLACDLLAALPDSATVVWVGDTDQLPSVGAGSVLGDLIKSGVVPSTKLDFIFRQDTSGLIVTNAHHVNAGEPLEIRQGDTDFYFMRCEDPAMCVQRAIEFMTTRIPRKFGMDPLADVQILVPMRKNVLGTDNLNVELQKALNPHGDAIVRGGTTFRVGDRVMQLRNNYDKDVYNGDIGFVKAVSSDDRSMVVNFDGRPVKYDGGDLDELVLAYAMTIHKSQGSEYPAVIVILHTQHYVMLQRNLLYTAITRGRKLVLLMGVPYAIDQAIKTNTVRERRTSLAERLSA